MPHIEGVSVATHALKQGTKELNDLLKEWMVAVTFSVGNLRLEYFVKGMLDLRSLHFCHSTAATPVHRKHRIDQNGFKDELVRLDWLSIVYHLCQLL